MPISLNPSIHSLILRYNQFHSVDASFNFYPELEVVDLSHNQLVSVPDRAFKSQGRLRDLRLNNNKISQLRHLTFAGLRSLESLDLRHNLLEVIPSEAYSDLATLELLDLSHNQIREIDKAAFEGSSLKILRLEANSLTAVPTAALGRLTGLLELQLSRNRLVTLPDGSFAGLRHLTRLDLSGNQLEKLHERSFVGLDSLLSLRLDDNSLYELATPVLRPLGASLSELWLGQNRFTAVPPDWLADVSRLTRLDLSNCPELRSIAAESFSANRELDMVTIAANPLLADLHPAAFRGLASVSRLDLSNNALVAIAPGLVPWERLDHLQVSGNPLTCTCADNYFLKEVVIRTALNSSEAVRVVRCWTPLHLRDVDLARLHLSCEDDEAAIAASGDSGSATMAAASISTVAGLVAAGTVVLVVCLVLLVCCLYPAACLLSRRHHKSASQLPAKDILQYDEVAGGAEPRYVSPHYAHHNHRQLHTTSATGTVRPYLVNIVANPYDEEGRQFSPEKGGGVGPPTFYYYTTDRRQAEIIDQQQRADPHRAAPPFLSSAAGTIREPLYYAVSSNSNSGGGDQSTTTLLKIDTNNYHYVDRESMY